MKNSTIQFRANHVVKTLPSSGYKMGDKKTLNVTLPNGTIITATHDTREWYGGRGAKYNNSIRHGNIVKNMTMRQLNQAWKPVAEEIKTQKAAALRMKKYLATCNDPANLEAAARAAVKVVGQPRYTQGRFHIDGVWYDGLTEDQARQKWAGAELAFWLSNEDKPYSGCGVYRIGWRNGKITCGLYGGYHNSIPYGVEEKLWIAAVNKVMAEHADHIVKMDGSGTEFFFRNQDDADMVTIATTAWLVPSASGFPHLNIQAVECQILDPKRISNG